MRTIANRTASLSVIQACALAIAVALAGPPAFAQAAASAPAATKPPAPATYSGCVQKAPDSTTTLVISTPTACALLTGKVSVDKLAGHQVELTGILTPRTANGRCVHPGQLRRQRWQELHRYLRTQAARDARPASAQRKRNPRQRRRNSRTHHLAATSRVAAPLPRTSASVVNL